MWEDVTKICSLFLEHEAGLERQFQLEKGFLIWGHKKVSIIYGCWGLQTLYDFQKWVNYYLKKIQRPVIFFVVECIPRVCHMAWHFQTGPMVKLVVCDRTLQTLSGVSGVTGLKSLCCGLCWAMLWSPDLPASSFLRYNIQGKHQLKWDHNIFTPILIPDKLVPKYYSFDAFLLFNFPSVQSDSSVGLWSPCGLLCSGD